MIIPTLKPVIEAMPNMWEGKRTHWSGFSDLYKNSGLMEEEVTDALGIDVELLYNLQIAKFVPIETERAQTYISLN